MLRTQESVKRNLASRMKKQEAFNIKVRTKLIQQQNKFFLSNAERVSSFQKKDSVLSKSFKDRQPSFSKGIKFKYISQNSLGEYIEREDSQQGSNNNILSFKPRLDPTQFYDIQQHTLTSKHSKLESQLKSLAKSQGLKKQKGKVPTLKKVNNYYSLMQKPIMNCSYKYDDDQNQILQEVSSLDN